MNGLTALLLILFGFPDAPNLRQYTFSSRQRSPITSYACVLSTLPNGDRVNIPVVNGRVPVLYIEPGAKSDHITMDYDDQSCAKYKGEKAFSYYVGGVPSVPGPSVLETFSEIKRQIESIKEINKSGLLSSDQKLDQAVTRLKELEAMTAQNQKELNRATSSGSDNKQGISEIKGMISDLRRELNQIKDKLDVKASASRDIIDPKLPILDKALIPGSK